MYKFQEKRIKSSSILTKTDRGVVLIDLLIIDFSWQTDKQTSLNNKTRKLKLFFLCDSSYVPLLFQNIMRGTWHKCETCTMTFRQHSDLQKHWVTHTHEKPHKCQFCGKGFTQLGSKYRHERIACSLRPDAAL